MTETVTETATPAPAPSSLAAGTNEDPTIVRLDNDTTALLLLVSCLSVACLGMTAALGLRD